MGNTKQVKARPAKRTIGDEHPSVGLMRLKEEREREVQEKDLTEWNDIFTENLAKMNMGLKDAKLDICYCGMNTGTKLRLDGAGVPLSRVTLSSHGLPIAILEVAVNKRENRVEAAIERVQGKGNKEQIDQFRRDNKERWNIFLVEAAKAAAYDSEFDRVLYRDITTTQSYESPSFPRERTLKDVRDSMRLLNISTRKQCDFKEQEGDYFVREFP